MLTTLMHASVNMGCQGKSGPGKIHEVILVEDLKPALTRMWVARNFFNIN